MKLARKLLVLAVLCACGAITAGKTKAPATSPTLPPFNKSAVAYSVGRFTVHRVGRSVTSSLFTRLTPEVFNEDRKFLLKLEQWKSLGADVELNERELKANRIIMAEKNKDYEEGLVTPHLFAPSQHLFSVLEKIRQSPLFHYLSSMPKGAVLHAHDTALGSTKILLQLTYRARLWVCLTNNPFGVLAFRFAKQRPELVVEGAECQWQLMRRVRERYGAQKVDEYLTNRFSLYPKEKYVDNNAVWRDFMDIFMLLDGLLCYAPNWGDYFYNALLEFYEDKVQYLEFRTTLPKLYDLDGTNYTELDTVKIYKTTLDKFLAAHPGFVGAKFIYAPVRNVDDTGLTNYINIAVELKDKYPDFFAGFDLVGQEELGRPLKDFVPQLLTMPANIDFFFHAGETNWYGSSIDENLIDAILLGTKRIGHGFSLVKHPLLLEIVKDRKIAIEVNPISNQVLQLVGDYRNHPCAHFFSDNYPVVISSDDPSFWRATPLSHDFYIAFLGIASAHSDIRLLKRLALNSIEYSSLDPLKKISALNTWQTQWDDFIDHVVGANQSHIAVERGASDVANPID